MIAPVRPAVRAGAVGLSGLAAKRLSPLSTVELDRYNGNHFSVVPELGLIAVGRGVRADEYRLSLLDFGGELVQEIKNHSAVFAAAPGPNGQWLIADEYSMAAPAMSPTTLWKTSMQSSSI